jgi:hypothetical protein
MKYIDIQNEIIERYQIDICDGTKCPNDWSRTHAHLKIRRVCKWKQANSAASTFTLLHEVGHIVTNRASMHRYEQEYYATQWAIDRCADYGIPVPQKTVDRYQKYIELELQRGIRRGLKRFARLHLKNTTADL